MAHCVTPAFNVISLGRILRASAVFISICGCITTTNNPEGTGKEIISNGSVGLAIVIPPKIAGAILSACLPPDATISPAKANSSNSFFENGLFNKALAATTAPAQLAELEPRPLPGFIFLCTVTLNPVALPYAFINDCKQIPIKFFSGSSDKPNSSVCLMLIPGRSESSIAILS